MTVEHLIDEYQAKGMISPEMADRLREVYRNETASNPVKAPKVVATLLKYYSSHTVGPSEIVRRRRPARTSVRVLSAAVGAVLGLAAVGFVLLLHSSLFNPTTLSAKVAIVAVIIGAVGGAALGWKFKPERLRRMLDAASLSTRAWIAWGVVWTAGTVIAFTLFALFRRYESLNWRARDVIWFVLIWAGPIVAGWAITRLVAWVVRGRSG